MTRAFYRWLAEKLWPELTRLRRIDEARRYVILPTPGDDAVEAERLRDRLRQQARRPA